MNSTVYLLNYKNYYNKSLDKLETITDYLPYLSINGSGDNPIAIKNFNPNDGVSAEMTVSWDGDTPDYVIVETAGYFTRWYVLESHRVSQSMYKLSLYRDLLVDFYDSISNSPLIVHKGYCGLDDPAIYNNEDYAFNSIKKREDLLKDNTRCPWVVGYCAYPKAEEAQAFIRYGLFEDTYDYYVPNIQDWDYYQWLDPHTFAQTQEFTIGFKKDNQNSPTVKFDADFNLVNASWKGEFRVNAGYIFNSNSIFWNNDFLQDFTRYKVSSLYTSFLNNFTLINNNQMLDRMKNELNEKIIKIGSNTYKKIRYQEVEVIDKTENVNPLSTLGNTMTQIITKMRQAYNGTQIIAGDANITNFQTHYTATKAQLVLEDYTPFAGGTGFNWPMNRQALKDAPYCMFCMPYSDNFLVSPDGQTSYYTSKENALSVASGIATSLGTNLYDIQLLPYCPYDLIRNTQDMLDAGLVYVDLSSGAYSALNDENQTGWITIEDAKQIIFFSPMSEGSFTIYYDSYDDFKYDGGIIQKKTKIITQSYRLNSPNYNATYEFNPHKNGGVEYFTVDYAYKPYQPYIHVAPNWGGLYGKNFNDAKGLICSGDFSLPIVNDEWTNYVINNKNYEQVFKAQIDTNDFVRKWERRREIAGVITGAIGAGAQAGIGGTMATNPTVGLIAGGVSGAVSAGAGAYDVYANQKIYEKQKQLTMDTFTLNNESVQARPYTLSKVGALNPNNKLFPFVEVYGTTDEEYLNISIALGFNGFNINRVQYLENVIQFKPAGIHAKMSATIPYLYDIIDDSHIAFAINEELQKGVIL